MGMIEEAGMVKKGVDTIGSLTYEQAFEELEKIVKDLENNPPGLDATLKLYERGQALARHCSKLLDQSELKVRQLSASKVDQAVE
jgi:exodeoxyribonuclease VII small subunit